MAARCQGIRRAVLAGASVGHCDSGQRDFTLARAAQQALLQAHRAAALCDRLVPNYRAIYAVLLLTVAPSVPLIRVRRVINGARHLHVGRGGCPLWPDRQGPGEAPAVAGDPAGDTEHASLGVYADPRCTLTLVKDAEAL